MCIYIYKNFLYEFFCEDVWIQFKEVEQVW